MVVEPHPDLYRFVSYYEDQVGSGLPGFHGAPMMYGRGLGSIFSKLFRFVTPMVKKGFTIAKPHLQNAAKNIASDVVSRVVRRVRGSEEENQEGSGLMLLARRAGKRPPGRRVAAHKKRKSTANSNSVQRRRSRGRKAEDIFS